MFTTTQLLRHEDISLRTVLFKDVVLVCQLSVFHSEILWNGFAKTAEAAGRGPENMPDFTCEPPDHVRTHLRKWLSENRIAQPTKDSAIVGSRHHADSGTYGVVPELAAQLPALASTCMADKGMRYKSTWEAWAPVTLTLDGGDAWTFDVKKPEEGLILVGEN